jgi:hypothetical protein
MDPQLLCFLFLSTCWALTVELKPNSPLVPYSEPFFTSFSIEWTQIRQTFLKDPNITAATVFSNDLLNPNTLKVTFY